MSAFSDEIAGICEEMEDFLEATITTPTGRELPCIPGWDEISTDVEVGPQRELKQFYVLVRKSHFITADNTVITADSDVILADNSTGRARSGVNGYRTGSFRGGVYRVLAVSEDPSGAYFKIYLIDPTS